MTAVTDDERKIRFAHMKMFGTWLKDQKRSQRWAGAQLGIYPGYVSNLVTGKQMASEAVCRAAGKLMGPLDMTTGKPFGTAWTAEEARERVREEQRKADKKLHQRLRKKTKKEKEKEPELAVHLVSHKKPRTKPPTPMKTCRKCGEWVTKSHTCAKKVAVLRKAPAKPEELPFDVAPNTEATPKAIKQLPRKPSKTIEPADTPTSQPQERDWRFVTYYEIETVRKKLCISKIKMAAQLGVTNSTYHNWKRGKVTPSFNRQQEIKAALYQTPPSFGSRAPTQVELDATVSVVTTWIKTAEPNSLTPEDVTEVTRALIAGFTSE